MKSFTGHSIPTDNIVGFAADECNVMMVASNSVASRLREQCPGFFVMKCICHTAHLCTSKACKQLPRGCEDLARDIYSFFKNISKQQCQLSRIFEYQTSQNITSFSDAAVVINCSRRTIARTAECVKAVFQQLLALRTTCINRIDI